MVSFYWTLPVGETTRACDGLPVVSRHFLRCLLEIFLKTCANVEVRREDVFAAVSLVSD